MTQPAKLTLIDPDPFHRYLIDFALTPLGLNPAVLPSIEAVHHAAIPDLALIAGDIDEPGDGFALARSLRHRSARVGIVMITDAGRAAALDAGADDAVPTQMRPPQLIAAVRAVLRVASLRTDQPSQDSRLPIGVAILDLDRQMLLYPDGVELPLAPPDFLLLRLFVQNPGRPMRRDWLGAALGLRSGDGSRAVDARVGLARRRVERNPAHPRAIRSIHGVGYVFVPDADG